MPKLKRGRGNSQRSLNRSAKKARLCQTLCSISHRKKNAEKVRTPDKERKKKWRTTNKKKDNLSRDERRFCSEVQYTCPNIPYVLQTCIPHCTTKYVFTYTRNSLWYCSIVKMGNLRNMRCRSSEHGIYRFLLRIWWRKQASSSGYS